MSLKRSKSWRGVALLAGIILLCVVSAPAETQVSPPLEDWCCEYMVGDVDMSGGIDITDISVLIDNQFLTLTPLLCWGEADIDFSYSVDITDLQMLIDYMFFCDGSGPGGSCFHLCPPPPLTGSLLSMTGCKGPLALAATPDDIEPDQSCISWEYDGTGTLSLSHINAGFNCCPTLDVSIDVQGGTITLHEVETLGECFCLCLFDLEFEITNLPPGEYRVVAEEPYVDEGMEALDFSIDLTQAPSGVHCVERTEYPWGIVEER